MPLNQTVLLSFPSRHAVRYRGLAEEVPAGRVQVFFHHGCAYAVDQWPTLDASLLVDGLLFGVRKTAILEGRRTQK